MRPVWSPEVRAGRKGRRQAQVVIGVLDVGTSKTVCVIAAAPSLGDGVSSLAGVQVLGVGEQPTRGLAAGRMTLCTTVAVPEGARSGLRRICP